MINGSLPSLSLEERGGRILFSIPARPRNWPLLLVLLCWLPIWSAGAIQGLINLGHVQAVVGSVALGLWFIAWTIGGAVAVFKCAWMIVGREVLVISGQIVVAEYWIAPFRWRRYFDASRIQNVRVAPFRYGRRKTLLTFGLAFEYIAKTQYFGLGLDESRLRELCDAFRYGLQHKMAD
jgi:hypothetical protein